MVNNVFNIDELGSFLNIQGVFCETDINYKDVYQQQKKMLLIVLVMNQNG
jgi:hypothetical protein